MTETVETYADYTIRKALGFAGLAVGVVMLSLSFDPPLALRTGADMLAVVLVALLVSAWRVPRRNIRRSEMCVLLIDRGEPWTGRLKQAAWLRLLSVTLRRRLLWHADRIAAAALMLWVLAVLARLLVR
jgi:hypothetical protein